METILYDFAGEDMVGWYLVLGIWLQAHGCVAIPRTAPASQTKPNTNYQLPNTGTWYLAASPRLHFHPGAWIPQTKLTSPSCRHPPTRPVLPDKANYQLPTTNYQIPKQQKGTPRPQAHPFLNVDLLLHQELPGLAADGMLHLLQLMLHLVQAVDQALEFL